MRALVKMTKISAGITNCLRVENTVLLLLHALRASTAQCLAVSVSLALLTYAYLHIYYSFLLLQP